MSTATKPTFLSRDAILGLNDRTPQILAIPEWGTSVRVVALTGRERDQYLRSLYTMKSNGTGGMEVDAVNIEGAEARLTVLSTVDENGQHLFSEADIPALIEKNGAALARIYKVATELSGLKEKVEQVKADLGPSQNGSSGSV